MTSTRGSKWSVVLLALALPFLSTLGCTSNPAQFMGRGQPDAYQRTPCESLRVAGTQVGAVVGAAALLAGSAVALLWLWSHEDDDECGLDCGWGD